MVNTVKIKETYDIEPLLAILNASSIGFIVSHENDKNLSILTASSSRSLLHLCRGISGEDFTGMPLLKVFEIIRRKTDEVTNNTTCLY